MVSNTHSASERNATQENVCLSVRRRWLLYCEFSNHNGDSDKHR